MTRERYNCPAWCVVPPEQHEAELEGWEGGAVHRTVDLADEKADDKIVVTLCTDAAGRVDEGGPSIFYGGDTIDADTAAYVVTGLAKAVALVG